LKTQYIVRKGNEQKYFGKRRRIIMFSYVSRLLPVAVLWALTFVSFSKINDHIGKVEVEAYNIIKVCQNKHCCKRNKDVLQTIYNLVGISDDNVDDKIVVESSGCLSHCDMGPNIEVTTKGDKKTPPTILNGMTDVQTIAFQLGELSTIASPSFLSVPKLLIAASKVIEQSEKFATDGQHEEQIRYLTSVIGKLENSPDPSISPSTTVNAHAHAIRARAYLRSFEEEQEEKNDDKVISAAIHDAQRVVRDLSAVATPMSISLAYRAWTDAELILAKQQKQQQNNEKAIDVLSQWSQAQPKYTTKLQGEIDSLRRLSVES
jgi:hypothetical protein